MASGRTRNATLNIAFSLLLQLVTFVRGMILPKIIIPMYGSDVNGLISSVSQFLAYISLLEAGVGSIFRASLYKPLAAGDTDGVSGIINEQKRFYRKIGCIFAGYVVALLFVYPMIAKTNTDKPYIISIILVLSVSTFVEYFFSLPYICLLSADQKIRINYIVSIVYTLANIVVSLFWVSLKADIRMIYLSMCIIGLLKPLFYTQYVRKNYGLNSKAKPDKMALSQRWNGMVHHFAYYIHTNTDVALLTVFVSTAMVSVYNVYGAVTIGVEQIISSIANGAAAGIGNLMATGEKDQINQTLNVFELVQGGVATVLFTIAALLLIPFIRIYTVDMTDANYIHPLFGYVFILAEAIYCFRCIYSTVSTGANKFKETQLGAVLECGTNLIVSLVLVLIVKAGLLGVAIGTAVAMLVRYAFEIQFLSRNVVFRPVGKAIRMLVGSAAISAISIVSCNLLLDYQRIHSLAGWIIYAVITSVIVGCIAVVGYFILNGSTMKLLVQHIVNRG